MRTINQIVILFLLMVASCSAPKEVTKVQHISHLSDVPPTGLIYSLPRSTLRVRIEVEYNQVVPGPYSQFAEKFLGIEGVILEPSSTWAIVSVEVYSETESDPNALYAILPQPNASFNHLTLSNNGIIILSSDIYFTGTKQSALSGKDMSTVEQFTDLSPSPFISAERTTHYSRVFQDSAFVRVPVHKNMVVERTLEEKAREAAEFIFSLRKRRYELIAGDADFIADGKAVEPIFNELQRLEQNYLSLFIGQRSVRRMAYLYDFIPKGEESESSILCRFSPTKGIVPPSDLSAGPVLLTVSLEQPWKGVEALSQLSKEGETSRTDALYYRIPAPVHVKVMLGSTELYSRRFRSHQHGPLLRVPAELLPSLVD